MRKLKLKNNENYKTHTSLIFFTQVLEELLFDHSDDSYKAPALSTPARISELIRLVIDTKNAGISYENLTPFIEELKWSISREIVLDVGEKSFCINICEQFSSDGAKPDLTISKLKTIRLVFDGYFKKLLSLLKICLLDKDFSKKDVYLLSTQLVSHAEFEGYHRRYISLITKKYLANKLANTQQIDIKRTFDNFSSKFDGKVREWEVYVYTDKEVESYTDQSAPFGIVIPTKKIDFPEAIPVNKFNGYSSDDRILIVLGDINAYDADTARNTALDRLEGFLSTIAFCCHDKVINYTEPVLLHDKTTDFWVIVDKRPNPMVIGNRSSAEDSTKDFEKIVSPLLNRKLAPISTRKLLNAFVYHRAALESRLPENQLVDLWAALEGLLPSPEGVRIKFFCNTLSSVLTLTHTEKLLRVFQDNLNHESMKVKNIVASIEGAGETQFERIVALISVEELEQNALKLQLLLKKKIHYFYLDFIS